MTKRIKRIAALIIAGILLVCVSFASLAEGTEEIFDTEYTEAPVADEATEETAPAEEETVITAETEETAEDAGNADEASEETADEGKETGDAVNEETAAAEEAEEQTETGDTAETENNVEEKTGETTETAETETEDAGDTEEAEEEYDEPADDESDEYDELADDEYDELADDDESDEEMEYQILDDDGGYIDPEVVSQHIPEITEELIEASEKVGQEEAEETEETEADEDAEEDDEVAATVKAWITREENGEAYIGDTITLVAKAESELNGEIRWETRDEQWDEGVWQKIGTGRKLELTITAENADNVIRFTTEDGVVSEEYKMNAEERSFADAQDDSSDVQDDAEAAEAEGEGRSFADAQDDIIDAQDDSSDVQDDAEAAEGEEEGSFAGAQDDGSDAPDDNSDVPDDAEAAEGEEGRSFADAQDDIRDAQDDAEAAETEGEGRSFADAQDDSSDAQDDAVIRAWVTGSEGDGSVTLSANADPELTGVCTWQKMNDEGAWKKIGYGDTATVDKADGVYRFVMQDGTVSEEFAVEGRSFADAQDDANSAQDDANSAQDDANSAQDDAEAVEDEGEEGSFAGAQDDAIDAQDDTSEVAEDTADAQDEEDADKEIPKLPEDRSVNVVLSWDDDHPGFGSMAHFTAELTGYEGFAYTLQWMESTDNENWTEVEGATGERLDVVIDGENYQHYWRVEVHVAGAEEISE